MVTASIDGITDKIVAMVTSWLASEDHAPALPTQVVPESVLSKIPKEWNYTSQNAQEKESANGTYHLLVPPGKNSPHFRENCINFHLTKPAWCIGEQLNVPQ